MVITYKKPPTNKPFDYPRIALPVNLTLNDVKANLVRYQQVTRDPIDFKQAHIQSLLGMIPKSRLTKANWRITIY